MMDIVFGYSAENSCYKINFRDSDITVDAISIQENYPFLTFRLNGDQLLDLKSLIEKKLMELF